VGLALIDAIIYHKIAWLKYQLDIRGVPESAGRSHFTKQGA